MDKMVVVGNTPLRGTITVSGSKNAVLPILAAALLTSEPCRVRNVPDLRDVQTMIRILRSLDLPVEREQDTVTLTPGSASKVIARYELVKTMRASICVLGPLLARHGRAQVSLPGGCVIGQRPIDLHIKGLRALGADIEIKHGYLVARAKELRGAHVFLGGAYGSSVLATANVMMAATLARGMTLIENAACEPEIEALADFLVAMGARITGQGTPKIKIDGVRRLGGTEYSVIPDRIEAGTYMIAAAITNGDLTVRGARRDHLSAVIDKLEQMGVAISYTRTGIQVRRQERALRPVAVTTMPYPGFPTDMQAQIMSLAALSNGISVITEKIYPDRFMHVSELNRMGADIFLEGASAIVRGVRRLSGAPVMASDLRASAALVLAGLVATGRSDISRIYHLDRGYEGMEKKLIDVGARIRREKE